MHSNFFNLAFDKKVPKTDIPLTQQRKLWFREFMKSYVIITILYIVMYMMRDNFKAAQPLMKQEFGITTEQLGTIGFIFSIVYGFGKFLISYLVTGKDNKKLASIMLMSSSVVVICIGILFSFSHPSIGALMILWAMNGLCQCAGGPSAGAVIMNWTTRKNIGLYSGIWSTSHNIGGALAGLFALWCARTFFGGHVMGMFLIPGIFGLLIGILCFSVGKNRPEDLGWGSAEEIFGEPAKEQDVESTGESTWQIFRRYVLTNPWIWVLCFANIFVYLVRIGVDNWATLRAVEDLHMSTSTGVQCISYFQMGALLGCVTWGWISDKLGGRPGMVATLCAIVVPITVFSYQHSHSPMALYISLFFLGMFIFGSQTLINISVLLQIPKRAAVVAGGWTGLFAYLFGDSSAKIMLARIADPTKSGFNFFGHVLHGWNDTFVILYFAAAMALILLGLTATKEERMLRASKAAR